jgi:hypothetical protein
MNRLLLGGSPSGLCDMMADAVGDGAFMTVLADDVLAEEAECAVVGCRQARQVGVRVLDDLASEIVNGAVALIDDAEVEELRRDLLVVDGWQRLFRACEVLGGVTFLGAFVERLVFQDGVHPLDSADADLAAPGDERALQALDVVKLCELPVVVIRQIRHKLLLGLLAKVLRVHEEQYALSLGLLQEAIDRGGGGEGLARAGRHLYKRSRAVIFEGCFQILNCPDLVIA